MTGTVIRPPATLCFGASPDGGIADPTPQDPAAVIEQTIETLNGVSYVHIRVTFDPAFVDNTYGANASAGWFQTMNGKTGKGHTFVGDLTGSDKIELKVTDGSGATVLVFNADYIHSLTATGGKNGTGGSASTPASACGFATLGVLGGDGSMITGDASSVLAVATSISRNVDGCGYCASAACSAGGDAGNGDCTVNSPATNDSYAPNPLTPNWNYDVQYEVWLDLAAFGTAGFGQAYIEFVHASPSKIGQNTLYVAPTPCPPGTNPCLGEDPCPAACPPNFQTYTAPGAAAICTPIPFAGYPGMAPCPAGYQLDTATEGHYCLPIPT
jgi:hypothetical protein